MRGSCRLGRSSCYSLIFWINQSRTRVAYITWNLTNHIARYASTVYNSRKAPFCTITLSNITYYESFN